MLRRHSTIVIDDLATNITMLSVTKLEQIYANQQAHVTVWKCVDESSQKLLALKEQGFPTKSQSDEALREYRIQKSLNHPNICKVISYYQEQRADITYNVLAIEWMDKQDLYKDLSNRSKNGYPWTEEELWGYFRGLISALAMAQRKGISHRDIKPQNVFINSLNEIKIGDFGSATMDTSSGTHTVVGTPYFLSPLLKSAFVSGAPKKKVLHNLFKSDVYSLGVTFLFMAKLQTPIAMGTNVSEEAIAQAVQGINYSDTMKSMLLWMLANEESRRPDFLEVNSWLNPQEEIAPTVQEVPDPNEGRHMKCPTCFFEFQFSRVPWTASLNENIRFCSIDCYLVMQDTHESSRESDVLCLGCRKWTDDAWLFSCGSHGVCSLQCGRGVIKNTSQLLRMPPKCPECEVLLEQALLDQIFEGAFKKVRETLENLLCEGCNQVRASRTYLLCGHAFCDLCYRKGIMDFSGYFLCPSYSQCRRPYINRVEA